MKRKRKKNTYKFYCSNVTVHVVNYKIEESFSNEWVDIRPGQKENTTIIKTKFSEKKKYAWDGCSPKYIFLQLCFGTPDGMTDPKTELPITYEASKIHDLLYQFKSQSPFTRKQADMIFKDILRQSNFKLWWLYYSVVRILGWIMGRWKNKNRIGILSYLRESWRAYLEFNSEQYIIYDNCEEKNCWICDDIFCPGNQIKDY